MPNWVKEEKTSFKTINARAETLLVKPSFKNLIQSKRCIIPVTGFFEWHRNTRKPMHIQLKTRKLFGFAGLYDTWTSPTGDKVSSCTIITCRPNTFMNPIHDRMPVILSRDGESLWLDRSLRDQDQLMHLLEPYADNEMTAYEVSPIVGNVNNDVPECIARVG